MPYRKQPMGEGLRIIAPKLGQITQGTIFSCAVASSYDSKPAFGFIITARCDIDQDKFPVLNYLPIVSLDDWLERDGFDILLNRATADFKSQLDSIMKTAGLPMSLLNSQDLQSIGNSFFVEPFERKELKTCSKKFHELVAKHATLETIANSSDHRILYSTYDKLAHGMLKELISHRLGGHYFLSQIEQGGAESGYVILLRETQHLPRTLALAIARGLDSMEAARMNGGRALSFTSDNFCMPIGQLTSPAVEHVLQSFSTLFGRIGLEDHTTEFIDAICARRPA